MEHINQILQNALKVRGTHVVSTLKLVKNLYGHFVIKKINVAIGEIFIYYKSCN